MIMPDQMVHLRTDRTVSPQEASQQFELRRNTEAKVRCSTFRAVSQHTVVPSANAARHRPEHNWANALGAKGQGSLPHAALHAAGSAVRNQQYRFRACPKCLPTLHVQSASRFRHGVYTLKVSDQRIVP